MEYSSAMVASECIKQPTYTAEGLTRDIITPLFLVLAPAHTDTHTHGFEHRGDKRVCEGFCSFVL